MKAPYVFFFGALTCALLSAAAWLFVSLPAAMSLGAAATPTRPAAFGFARLAKPTYTPVPTSTPAPVFNPPVVAGAQLVQDAPAPVYAGNKYILVDISEQHMYVYEGDALVFSFVASTGMNNATRVGSFSVLDKIPNAYGSTWGIWMPNWLGIYWAGGLENGIHALPILPNGATLWAGYLGVPISYGCVVLGTYESGLLYNWAEIGTPVEIRW